jgi:hypothetical protein
MGEHLLLAHAVATAVLLTTLIVLAVAFLAGGPPHLPTHPRSAHILRRPSPRS